MNSKDGFSLTDCAQERKAATGSSDSYFTRHFRRLTARNLLARVEISVGGSPGVMDGHNDAKANVALKLRPGSTATMNSSTNRLACSSEI